MGLNDFFPKPEAGMSTKRSEKKSSSFRSTPEWREGAKKAQKNFKDMKFESEGQKRDYLRAVSQHECNVPGYPIFYPPPLLWGVGIGDGEPCETLPCGHVWKKRTISQNGNTTYSCRLGHEFGAIDGEPV